MSRSSQSNSPRRTGARPATRWITWLSVGVVLLAVGVLTTISLTSRSSSVQKGNGWDPSPQALTNELTHIPTGVYDSVGVSSSAVQVDPPKQLSGQPNLSFKGSSGAMLPGVFYFGAEY